MLNQRPVSDKPDDPKTMLMQAVAHYEAAEYAQARVLCEEILKSLPRDYGALHLAGVIAAEEHRLPEAGEFLKQALVHAPDSKSAASSWYVLGKALRAAGDLRQAEEALRRAMFADHYTCEYPVELADIYAEGWKLDPAIETLKAAVHRFFNNALPCVALGNLLNRYGKQEQALEAYKLAIERKPDYAEAYVAVSGALMMLGRFSEAEAPLREALHLNPMIKALYQLAQSQKFVVSDADLAAIEKRLEPQTSVDRKARIDALFALSKIYDRRKDYAAAFRYLDEATKLHRSSVPFQAEEHAALVERIIALFTCDFLDRYSGRSNSDLAPIFIVGMFRSGTTLVEQILASHSRVLAGGELLCMVLIARQLGTTWERRGKLVPGDDLEMTHDLSQAAARYREMTAYLSSGDKRITDKLPLNFLHIGIIHLLFPRAHIIYCHRNPAATCFSCYQNNILMPSDGSFTHDLTDLGRFYKLHERLMQHWQEVLPGRILQVEYEDLVSDPENQIRRLLKFCDLGFEPQCLEFHTLKRPVATASVLQVREPLYKGAVDHWRHYAQFLGLLFEALQMPYPDESGRFAQSERSHDHHVHHQIC